MGVGLPSPSMPAAKPPNHDAVSPDQLAKDIQSGNYLSPVREGPPEKPDYEIEYVEDTAIIRNNRAEAKTLLGRVDSVAAAAPSPTCAVCDGPDRPSTDTYRVSTKWDYVQLTRKDATVIIPGQRKDIILWETRYESWNWKDQRTLVDTSAKSPLVHSPGITFDAMDFAIQGCEKTRPCQVLVASAGWQNQLPIRQDALEQIKRKYPHVEVRHVQSEEAAEMFNTLMDGGVASVLMLHTTC